METCIVTTRSKSRKIWANSSSLAPWRGNGKRKVVALLFTPFCLGHQCLDERPCAVWFLMACIQKHLCRGGTTVHSSWCFLRDTELQKALQRPGTYFLYLLLEMQRLQKRLHCSVRWKGNSCWCRCRPGETCPLRTWWSQLLSAPSPPFPRQGISTYWPWGNIHSSVPSFQFLFSGNTAAQPHPFLQPRRALQSLVTEL